MKNFFKVLRVFLRNKILETKAFFKHQTEILLLCLVVSILMVVPALGTILGIGWLAYFFSGRTGNISQMMDIGVSLGMLILLAVFCVSSFFKFIRKNWKQAKAEVGL